MDNFVDERDYKLLEQDKYTFFVLRRIMGGECKILLTDHESLIMCFTGLPYSVWIWTPDGVTEADMERAYKLAGENGLLDGEHRFNVKYELAEYFMKRALEDGKGLEIQTNMFAYDNLAPVEPAGKCDGKLHQCVAGDVDELVEMMDLFHHDIDADYESLEAYHKSALDGIKKELFFFWQDENGRNVACCVYRPTGEMASIGYVYTREEVRRKHYAENLVYRVTKIASEAGFVPMLYTDADYVASNACYEKIGYVLRGKLCTIG